MVLHYQHSTTCVLQCIIVYLLILNTTTQDTTASTQDTTNTIENTATKTQDTSTATQSSITPFDNTEFTTKDTTTIFSTELITGNDTTRLIERKLIALIPKLDKEHFISFDVYPNKFEPLWRSVIHFTIGGNIDSYGDRVPGIWFLEDGKGGLYISAPINGDRNRFFETKPLGLQVWTNIEIYQKLNGSVYVYTFKVNGEIVFSEVNNQAQSFKNVKVYASDPWHEAQDGYIRNLYVINGVSDGVNQPIVVFNNSEFSISNDTTRLMERKLIALIPKLDKEHFISFDVYPNKFEPPVRSVIHFTTGGNINSYGDRVPGVWFLENGNGGLYIAAPINGDRYWHFETEPLRLQVWTKIEIYQSLTGSVYVYTCRINGEIVFSEVNNQAQSFENVKVYASDPWHEAQDGYIRNLYVINGVSNFIIGNDTTRIVKKKLIAEIPKLDKEHFISFDVYPNKFEPPVRSVIHFTTGGNINSYGDRVPGVWFLENSNGGLYIGAPINGDRYRYFETKPLGLQVWTKVEIYQSLTGSVYVYTCRINGEIVFSEVNNQAQSFVNVKVYASDPWHEAQDGYIRNLYVINGISDGVNQPIIVFNNSDTQDLSTEPTTQDSISTTFATSTTTKDTTTITGNWGNWVNETCSQSCGDGFLRRIRICNNGVLCILNGIYKFVSIEENIYCNIKPCVDPCSSCSENAQCVTIDGVRKCICNNGFIGNGNTCTVDPCSSCSENAQCVTIDGVRKCICNNGFIGNGNTCTDSSATTDDFITTQDTTVTRTTATTSTEDTTTSVYTLSTSTAHDTKTSTATSTNARTTEVPISSDLICPEGWIKYRNYCYLFQNGNSTLPGKSWVDSLLSCLNYGGNLLSVADYAENKFIANYLKNESMENQHFWIGLNALQRTFSWSDKTTSLFFNWRQGQPDNQLEEESCVEANSYGWNDAKCNQLFGFICKIKKELFSCSNDFEYDGYCYEFHIGNSSQNGLNWHISLSLCETHKGSLLSVANQAENVFISNHLRSDKMKNFHFWIGLNALQMKFVWSDKTNPFFFDWKYGEPSYFNKNKLCSEISSDGWNADCCDKRFGFICKVKLGCGNANSQCVTDANGVQQCFCDKDNGDTCAQSGPCWLAANQAKNYNNGIGGFIPQCDQYGNYKSLQFHGSTGFSWCVNVITGVEIEGTRVGPDGKTPFCDCNGGCKREFTTCINNECRCLGNYTLINGKCTGIWSDWINDTCSKRCGDGEMTRTRACKNGVHCITDSGEYKKYHIQTIYCNLKICECDGHCTRPFTKCINNEYRCDDNYTMVNRMCTGNWGNWINSACSHSCGDGVMTRTRYCKREAYCITEGGEYKRKQMQSDVYCNLKMCDPTTTATPTTTPTTTQCPPSKEPNLSSDEMLCRFRVFVEAIQLQQLHQQLNLHLQKIRFPARVCKDIAKSFLTKSFVHWLINCVQKLIVRQHTRQLPQL